MRHTFVLPVPPAETPVKAVGSVSTGSIPVDASEIIQVAEYLEERAAKLKAKSKLLYKTADILDAVEHWNAANVIELCAEILRRNAGKQPKRQPESNKQ
jgi:hypothetical protein